MALGIALPGPMTGLGIEFGLPTLPGYTPTATAPPPALRVPVDSPVRLDPSLSARLMDREPIWRELHPPIEETPIAKPFPWGTVLLYGGIAVGVLLIGRKLLK